MIRGLVIYATVSVAACSNSIAPVELRQLVEAESHWKSRGIRSYTFEMRTSCFCPQEITEWAVVEVRAGQIVAARSLTGTPLTGISLESRKTVHELFDAAKPPYQEWIGDVEFDFHDDLGYPLRINLIGKPNIADAGTLYEARNLVAISP